MATSTSNGMLEGIHASPHPVGSTHHTMASTMVGLLSNQLLRSTLLNDDVDGGDCKRARLDDTPSAAVVARSGDRCSTDNSLLLLGDRSTSSMLTPSSSRLVANTMLDSRLTSSGTLTTNSLLCSPAITSSILPSTCVTFSTPTTSMAVDVIDGDDDHDVMQVEEILAAFGDEQHFDGVDDDLYAHEDTPQTIAWTVRPDTAMKEEMALKTTFLRTVSMALVHAGNMTNKTDVMRLALIDHVTQLDRVDPEFVLKAILYTRTTLNIRTIANFLMACAATMPHCKTFIRKYFSKSAIIPSDMIEVADLYATFEEKRTGADATRFPLPVCLRKAMSDKFAAFDEYQLAKHNKAGKRKRKPKAKPSTSRKAVTKKKDARPQRAAKEIPKDAMTLKRLVRQLHIRMPAEMVMAIVGKKYPSTQNAFHQSGLLGTWEEARAGKRIKLKVPDTWETQVSLHGNKASVWEKLLDAKKLPFMAMLRNVRNLVKAGISHMHKKMVLRRLRDERQVVNSRQFPFRFFSAYQALDDLAKELVEYNEIFDVATKAVKVALKANPTHGKKKKAEVKKDDHRRRDRILAKGVEYSMDTIDEYRSALDEALRLATKHNIAPIAGHTLVVCDTNGSSEVARAKSLGVVDRARELSLLFGLLCERACEQSSVVAIANDRVTNVTSRGGMKATILKRMTDMIASIDEVDFSKHPGERIEDFFAGHLTARTRFDSIVVFGEASDEMEKQLAHFLRAYRGGVNENVIYISVDVCSSKPAAVDSGSSHPNNIRLAGISDQILRYIAERGNSAQLAYVNGIDVKHDLANVSMVKRTHKSRTQCLAAIQRAQPDASMIDRLRTKSMRVFISSTFNDMHFERAVIMRQVLPVLQRRLPANYVLHAVDLRWGVPEASSTSTASVEQCLMEAGRADILVVILGHRYGFRPKMLTLGAIARQSDELRWVGELRDRLSITELECRAFFRASDDKPVVCLTRSDEFPPSVPKATRSLVESGNPELRKALADLKAWVTSNPRTTHRDYPATFLKVKGSTPVVGGLADFANMALQSMQQSLEEVVDDETISESEPWRDHHCRQSASISSLTTSMVGRENVVARGVQFIRKHRHVRVLGGSGQGVTSVLSAIAEGMAEEAVVVPCLEATSMAEFVNYAASVLHRAVHEEDMQSSVGVNASVDGIRDYAHRLEAIGLDIVFVVDDLDLGTQLADVAESLKAKTNILWLTTAAIDGSSRTITVASLTVEQRKLIVRHQLATVGKRMQENTFANHLSHLIMKRDACNLQYLQLACDYLVAYSTFDTIAEDIRVMSSTLPQLVHDTIARMSTVAGGSDVVTNVLCLLAMAGDRGVPCVVLAEMAARVPHFAAHRRSALDSAAEVTVGMRIDSIVGSMIRGVQLVTRIDGATMRLRGAWMAETICVKFMQPERPSTNGHRLDVLKALAVVSMRYLSETVNGGTHFRTHLSNACKSLRLARLDTTDVLIKCIVDDDQLLRNAINSKCTAALSKVVAAVDVQVPMPEDLRRAVDQLGQFLRDNTPLLMKYPQLLHQQANNGGFFDVGPVAEHELLLDEHSIQSVDHREFHVSTSVRSLVSFVDKQCRYVVVGLSDGCLRLANTATGDMSAAIRAHAAPITTMALVDHLAMVTGAHDGSMTLWTMNVDKLVITRASNLQSHRVCVSAIAPFPWDARSKAFISVGWDGVIRQMAATQDMKTTATVTTSSPINCVAAMTDRALTLTGHWDGSLKLYDMSRSERKGVWFGHRGAVRAVQFTQHDRQAVSADIFGELRVWSTVHGTTVGTFNARSTMAITRIVTLDDSKLASTADDGTVTVWKSTLGRQLPDIMCAQRHMVVSVVANKSICAVATTDGSIVFYKRTQETCTKSGVMTKKTLGCESIVKMRLMDDMLFVATDTAFVTVDPHQQVVIHSVDTRPLGTIADFDLAFGTAALLLANGRVTRVAPDELLPTTTACFAHDDSVMAVAISTDGQTIASVGRDRSIVVYESSEDETRVKHTTREAHEQGINGVAFTTTRECLVTASADASVKVWTIDDDHLTMMTRIECHHSPIVRIALVRQCIVTADSSNVVCVSSANGSLVTQFTADAAVTDLCFDIGLGCGTSANDEIDWAAVMDETNVAPIDARQARRDVRDVVLEEVTLFVGTRSSLVHVHRPFVGESLARTVVGSSGIADALVDDGVLITGNGDGAVRLTKVAGMLDGPRSTRLHTASIVDMAVSGDGTLVLSLDVDGVVGLAAVGSSPQSMTFEVARPGMQCIWMSVSKFAVLHGVSEVTVFNVTDNTPSFRMDFSKRLRQRTHSLAMSPCSKSMLTINWENRVREIDLSLDLVPAEQCTIAETDMTIIASVTEPITNMAFISSSTLWTGLADATLDGHDHAFAPGGASSVFVTRNVSSMMATVDSAVFLMGTADGTILVLDVDTQRAHDGAVVGVGVLASDMPEDEICFCSLGDDRLLKLWRLVLDLDESVLSARVDLVSSPSDGVRIIQLTLYETPGAPTTLVCHKEDMFVGDQTGHIFSIHSYCTGEHMAN